MKKNVSSVKSDIFLDIDMEEININDKFLIIKTETGFGNKIFDMFISLYLKQLYNYKIFYVLIKSQHNNLSDPYICEVFPLLKNEINFISIEQFNKLKHKLKDLTIIGENMLVSKIKKYIKDIKDIENIIRNKNHIQLIPFIFYFIIKDIYMKLDEKYKNLFQINMNLIDKKIINLSLTKYAIIHIRYGDKLLLAKKKEKNIYDQYQFIINTPLFYHFVITKIRQIDANFPIYIVTDSDNIVKKFIIEKYNHQNDKNIHIINTSYINSFYLLLNSTIFVLSNSTFSYCAYLLNSNKNKHKLSIFSTINPKHNKINYVFDLFTLNNNTNDHKSFMLYDEKYILNFNQKLLKNMIDFYLSHKS